MLNFLKKKAIIVQHLA